METLKSPQEFLQAILEGFVDGILVLTDQKEQLYANATATRLCHHLSQQKQDPMPREIWQVCEALIDSREVYPNQPIVMETEAECAEMKLQIRAQWLQLAAMDRPCLLVRLQDQNQCTQGLALAEAQAWRLTNREAQVWRMRRAGYSRKQIANDLYIVPDTVKKHLKNIQVKRQSFLDEEEWRSARDYHQSQIPCGA